MSPPSRATAGADARVDDLFKFFDDVGGVAFMGDVGLAGLIRERWIARHRAARR